MHKVRLTVLGSPAKDVKQISFQLTHISGFPVSVSIENTVHYSEILRYIPSMQDVSHFEICIGSNLSPLKSRW